MMNPFGDSGEAPDRQFLPRLRREIAAWQADGTITPEQGQAILARYPAVDAAARRRQALVVGLSVLGAVLVGLGVITFFAANWNEIPRSVKLGALAAGVLLSYGAGFFLWQRLGYIAIGIALVLLGCIVYGAGVHLIAQIYHVPVDHPHLTGFWFLGVLPLAYVTRSRPVMFLTILLFLGAAGFSMADWLEDASGDSFVVLAAAVYLALGLLLYAIGRVKGLSEEWEPLGAQFRFVGLLAAFGATYLLTFHGIHEYRGDLDRIGYRYWILISVAAALALALLAGTAWLRIRRGGQPLADYIEGVAFAVLLAAAIIVASVPVDDEAVYAIVFNVLFSLAALGLMTSGYLQERETRVNLSLILIAVFVISRYFEYSTSLFDRSLVFVGAGVILLVGGFLLERGRRKMLAAMRTGDAGRSGEGGR